MFRLTSALVLLVGLIAILTLAGAATADTTQKQLEMDAKIAQLDALIKQKKQGKMLGDQGISGVSYQKWWGFLSIRVFDCI